MQSHDASVSVLTFKIPNTGRILLFGHTKILHLLIGMDGAALAAAVPYYSGKATRINSRNEVLIFFGFF